MRISQHVMVRLGVNSRIVHDPCPETTNTTASVRLINYHPRQGARTGRLATRSANLQMRRARLHKILAPDASNYPVLAIQEDLEYGAGTSARRPLTPGRRLIHDTRTGGRESREIRQTPEGKLAPGAEFVAQHLQHESHFGMQFRHTPARQKAVPNPRIHAIGSQCRRIA